MSHPGTPSQRLSVLNLSQSINDSAFVTSETGTLFITDSANNQVDVVKDGFSPGTTLVAVTPRDANNPVDRPNYLGSLNLWTGEITPMINSVQPGGLLFVPGGKDRF